MESPPDLEPVRAALTDCGAALVELEKTCCIPDRSPCIEEIGETLRNAATTLDAVAAEPDTLGTLVATLEDVGAQVGRLQVGCCAPNRIPLYARVLEGLTTAQLAVNQALAKATEVGPILDRPACGTVTKGATQRRAMSVPLPPRS